MITTTPIATIRYPAQDTQQISRWNRKKEPVLAPYTLGNIVVNNSNLGRSTEMGPVSSGLQGDSHVIDLDLQADFLSLPNLSVVDADAVSKKEVQF